MNDVVESCLHLERFRITFVVGRVRDADVDQRLAEVTATHDRLKPLVEFQRSEAISEAKTWMTQASTGTSSNASRQEQDHVLNRIGRAIAQFLGGSKAGQEQAYRWEQAPAQRSEGTSSTTSESAGGQRTDSTTATFTQIASALQLADQSLERYAQGLYRARATGGFRGAVFVQAHERDVRIVADAVRGVLSGERSKDRPLSVSPVEGAPDLLLSSNRPILDALGRALPILTDDQAGQLLLLPEAELPGFRMHRSVFLGRNAAPLDATGTRIRLGRFAFASVDGKGSDVEIDVGDLFRHVLVCGTTGAGKTRRVLKILNDLEGVGDDVRIIVFETAKRTYREEFSRFADGPRPRVYTVGNAQDAPLRINPFFFEPGTSLKRHVSVLADALCELMPTEALIGPKMREAVERAYATTGWDIETGRPRGDGPAVYPTTVTFVAALREVASELKYGNEVNANYLGALEGRARVFLDATFQDIFSHDGDRSLADLFDRDTIIELEGLPSSEIDLPAFLLSLLLERLRSHQSLGSRLRWLLVVEEAHNVLPRDAELQRGHQEGQGAHTLLKNFVRLLQEGRELGIGVMVVDQAPTMLARAVLKNANTKVVMRLEDGEEVAEMGRALGLPEDVWPDLGVLRQGEAVIKASYMTQPVKSSRYEDDELPRRLPTRPRSACVAPDYGALEHLWCRALSGAAVDAAWRTAAEEAALQRGDVHRYGLGRALLRDWEEPTKSEARHLLALYDRLPVDLDGLYRFAQDQSARTAGRALRALLLPVEQWMLAALAGWPFPPSRPQASALEPAALILAGGRTEERDIWMHALTRVARGTPGAAPATPGLLSGTNANPGPFDPVIRLHAARARGDASVVAHLKAPTFLPAEYLAAVGDTLDPVFYSGAPLDRVAEVREALLVGVARVLVRMERRTAIADLEPWL